MGADESHLFKNDGWEIIPGPQQVEIFHLIAFLFVFTSGASSPEWVQPTAERGGFLLCYVYCFVLFC
jgi:hypothetical protein